MVRSCSVSLPRADVYKRQATTYLLPALFGGIFLSFVNNDCGDYVAKGKPLTMILPLLVVFGVNAVFPLAGMEGFVVLICICLLYTSRRKSLSCSRKGHWTGLHQDL